MGKGDETGGFEGLLGIIGFIAGVSFYLEQDSEGCGGALITGLIVGLIGAGVGKMVDRMVAVLIAIVTTIIVILVNAAIRQFVLGILKAIFSS